MLSQAFRALAWLKKLKISDKIKTLTTLCSISALKIIKAYLKRMNVTDNFMILPSLHIIVLHPYPW